MKIIFHYFYKGFQLPEIVWDPGVGLEAPIDWRQKIILFNIFGESLLSLIFHELYKIQQIWYR